MRFFRFHATYGIGPLDAQGLAAAVAGRDGLDRLSRERVRGETLKLLAAPGAVEVLRTLDDTGLLARILGGPGDVGRMARLEDADPVLRLHALAVRNAEDVERLRGGLKLSNAERDRMLAALAAARSDRFAALAYLGFAPDEDAVRAMLFDHGGAATADALRLAQAAPDPAGDWTAALRAAGGEVPAMPFSGKDIVARGLKGPAVGEALARFRAAYRAAGFPAQEAERLALLDASLAPPDPAPLVPSREKVAGRSSVI